MNNYQGCAGSINPFGIPDFNFRDSEYIAEEKYDGIWCDISFDKNGDVSLISRTGKEKTNAQLNSLHRYLKENLGLKNSNVIGELAFSSQKGTDFARQHGHHKIDVIDVVKLNGEDLTKEPLLERKAILADILKKLDPLWANLGWYRFVKDGHEVEKLFKEVVKQGGEGLIIKDTKDENYRFGGKSPLWYKIKKFITFDYVIMGFSETESADFRDRGWIGGVIGGLYVDGELVKKITVGSMTFEWRERFSKEGDKFIGKVMEVGGFELFKSGALRHPSFVGMHDEKSPKECIWNE